MHVPLPPVVAGRRIRFLDNGFPDLPDALENTVKVAQKCKLEIPTLGKWFFPKFELPNGKTAETHLKELTLHIDRLLKMANIESKSLVKISKMYTYDLQKERLLFDNEEQSLTPKQAQIINLFACNINKIVDFDMLRHYVWHDSHVDNATIRAEVHRVKQVLKEDLIESLKGIGYRVNKNH